MATIAQIHNNEFDAAPRSLNEIMMSDGQLFLTG